MLSLHYFPNFIDWNRQVFVFLKFLSPFYANIYQSSCDDLQISTPKEHLMSWYRKSYAFYFGSSDFKYTFRFTIYTNNFLYQSLIDYQQGQHILIVLQPRTIKSNPRGILYFIQGKSDIFHQQVIYNTALFDLCFLFPKAKNWHKPLDPLWCVNGSSRFFFSVFNHQILKIIMSCMIVFPSSIYMSPSWNKVYQHRESGGNFTHRRFFVEKAHKILSFFASEYVLFITTNSHRWCVLWHFFNDWSELREVE